MTASMKAITKMPAADRPIIEFAQWQASDDLRMFPVTITSAPEGGVRKRPAIEGWQAAASTDPAAIDALFVDPHRKIKAAGIFTEKYRDGALLAVDVDVKDGRGGDKSLEMLQLEHGPLPATRRHNTPTGGFHLLFSVPEPVAQSVGKIGDGIDVRSKGGFIVAVGSRTRFGAYTLANDLPIAPAPPWLIALCGAPTTKAENAVVPVPGVDSSEGVARAVAYLKAAPIAKQGEGGDDVTFKVLAGLKDFIRDQALALELADEHYNPRCEPPWSIEDLSVKVRNAYAYGHDRPGSADPKAVFTPVVVAPGEPVMLAPLDKMNTEFAFCLDQSGTGHFILHETVDARGTPKINFLSTPSFYAMHANKTIQMGKKPVTLAAAWMEWSGRREYRGVVFDPSVAPHSAQSYYNLWQGLAFKPQAGDWSKFRAHLHENICSGNDTHFDYLLKWTARLMQRPGEHGRVAIVMRSGEGTGKGFFARTLSKLVGRHGLHLVNVRHLLGNFNEHLMDKVFIFADECFYAGDKQANGALNTLITEDRLVIEPKGRKLFETDNFVHLVMATNQDWAAPATASARRFFMLDVNEAHAQDTTYFGAIKRELESGGYEAFLHDLLAVDISDFDVDNAPKTAALAEQKDRSLRGVAAWLRQRLDDGSMCGEAWSESSSLLVRKSNAFDNYVQWVRMGKFRGDDSISTITFGRDLRRVLPTECPDAKTTGARREQAYRFAPLWACRDAFDKHMRQPMDWQEAGGGTASPFA